MSAEKKAAAGEFLNNLPKEMVELAKEAVRIKDKLEAASDPQARQKLQRELDLINREIILSARSDQSLRS